MATTNFSNGLSSYGIPVYGTQAPFTGGPPTGNVWFVNTSTGIDSLSAGGGNSPSAPLKSLSYAITVATANNGDIIYIMPGSTVTISDATSTAFSKAGLTIVGLGTGSSRPLFNYTTANTATIPVSANNVVVQNIRHAGNFLSIAAAYTVASALHFTCDNCLFTDASSVLNFLNIIKSTGAANTADGLTMTNNTWRGFGTTSVNSFILSANDIDRPIWFNNTVILARTATAPALATITAGVLTNLQCMGNNTSTQQTATTTGALIGVTGTTGTGLIGYNFCATLQSTAASDLLVTAGHKFGFVQNFTAGAADKSGILVPAAFS